MTAPGEILGQPERIRGAFLGALALHAALVAGFLYSGWLASHRDAFGAPDAGGAAVAIEAVNSIPLPHQGPQNPLASDTDSVVPQAPAKPVERVKEEAPPPDAIPLKTRNKKTPADVASEKNKFRPFKDIDPYQVYSKSAPAISSPAFAAKGGGNVGAGASNPLGTRCPGYASQIQQVVASHWNTSEVSSSIRSAPTIIARFELMHDGATRDIQMIQRSGVQSLDSSVERAIQDSTPLPPIPRDCGVDHASAEFWFELKR